MHREADYYKKNLITDKKKLITEKLQILSRKEADYWHHWLKKKLITE